MHVIDTIIQFLNVWKEIWQFSNCNVIVMYLFVNNDYDS